MLKENWFSENYVKDIYTEGLKKDQIAIHGINFSQLYFKTVFLSTKAIMFKASRKLLFLKIVTIITFHACSLHWILKFPKWWSLNTGFHSKRPPC